MEKNSVITLNKIYKLSNLFQFNSRPVYKPNYKNDDNNKIIEE